MFHFLTEYVPEKQLMWLLPGSVEKTPWWFSAPKNPDEKWWEHFRPLGVPNDSWPMRREKGSKWLPGSQGFSAIPWGILGGCFIPAKRHNPKRLGGGGFKHVLNVHPYLGKWSNLTSIFLQLGKLLYQNWWLSSNLWSWDPLEVKEHVFSCPYFAIVSG